MTRQVTRGALVAVALALAQFIARDASAQCAYDVAIISKPAAWESMSANDMNAAGVVVGSFGLPGSWNARPFRWDEQGGFVPLPMPPNVYAAMADQISDDGLIAGRAWLTGISDDFPQIIYWKEGVATVIPPGSPIHGFEVTVALGSSTLAGYTQTGNPELVPFVYQIGGAQPGFVTLPPILSANHTLVNDLTPDGWMCGRWYDAGFTVAGPYIYGDGALTILPPIDGVTALNVRGLTCTHHAVVVGNGPPSRGLSFTLKSFFWDGARYTPLPVPNGWTWTSGGAINDVEQIACGIGLATSNPAIWTAGAALWQNGETRDLHDLAPLPRTVNMQGCLAIRENGKILAMAKQDFPTWEPFLIVVFSPQAEPPDVTIDCVVDVRDLSFVLDNWGPVGPSTVRRADVDGDGTVGAYDLALVLGAWSPPR